MEPVEKNLLLTLEMFKEAGRYWMDHLSGELNKTTLPADINAYNSPQEVDVADLSKMTQNKSFSGVQAPRRGVPISDFSKKAPLVAEGIKSTILPQEVGRLKFSLESQQEKKLYQLSKNNDLSLYVILLTILKILLNRYTGREDMIVLSPTLSKSRQQHNRWVVFRSRVQPGMRFTQLLAEIRQTVVNGYKYQYYPIEKIIGQLKLKDPFAVTGIILRLAGLHEQETPSSSLSIHGWEGLADMGFSFKKTTAGMEGQVDYNARMYDPETIQRFYRGYIQALDQVLADLNLNISHIDCTTAEDKKRILTGFNSSWSAYPRENTIRELFQQQAKKSPGQVALVQMDDRKEKATPFFVSRSITYQVLDTQSDGFANLLREKGIKPGIIVAVVLKRSLEMIIALIGILKAGGAYLPIDTDCPQGRIDYMLADSSAKILISEGHHIDCQLPIANSQLSMSTSKGTGQCPGPRFPLLPANGHRPSAASLAYVIYTSGSTGRPKGVMVQQGNVVRLVKGVNYIRLTEGERLLMTGSIGFDIATFEIWGTLTNGVTLYLASNQMILDTEYMEKLVEFNSITILHLVPQLFNRYAEQNPGIFSRLKYFLVGGDTVRPLNVNRTRNKNPHLQILHMYGPTENTTFSTFFPVTRDYPVKIPIGKPVSDTTVYILDQSLRLQPIGAAGELCTGGSGVARGYLNQPELTDERFCLRRPGGSFRESPWHGQPINERRFSSALMLSTHRTTLIGSPRRGALDPRKNFLLNQYLPEGHHHLTLNTQHLTLYRTGDLARWLPDGNIELLGRRDHQIKIRGSRLEPGEIENRLLEHPAIHEAVVIPVSAPANRGEENEFQLCAYIITAKEKNFSIRELQEYLEQLLPDYMVPSYFVQLEQMPLTPNGKVDREKLPIPGGNSRVRNTVYSPPRDPLEKKMAQVWSGVIGIEEPGIDDNFFQCGGNSLKAMTYIALIQKELNVKIPLAELFNTPTLRKLSQYIRQAEKTTFSSLIKVEKCQYYPLSSPQKRLYALQQLEPLGTTNNLFHMSPWPGETCPGKLTETFKKLIKRHESLRTSFVLLDGEPVQRVYGEVEFQVQYYFATEDTEGKNYKIQITNYKQIPNYKSQITNKESLVGQGRGEVSSPIIDSFIRPFDLTHAPLLRAALVKTGGDKYILLVDMHHIISDGYSHQILIRDFLQLYSGDILPPLPLQYTDYAHWQNSEKGSGAYRQQEAFWVKEFEKIPPSLNLPLDYPRPKVRSTVGDNIAFEINNEQTTALNKIAQDQNTTLYAVLLAAYYVLIARLTNQEDIVVGTPVAGRRHADLTQIIGLFVNTLPLRNYPRGELTWSSFLSQVKTKALEAFENQEFQLEDLVERLDLQRDPSRNPLFDAGFTLENMTANPYSLENTAGNPYPGKNHDDTKVENPGDFTIDDKASRVDLTFYAVYTGRKITVSAEYSTRLFKETTIRQFINYFQEIISVIIADKHVKLNAIRISHHLFDKKLDIPPIDFNF